MKRCSALFASLSVVLLALSGRAAADASPIAGSLGDLRWGMSESEVVTFVKRKVDERYAEQARKASSSRKEQLKSEAKRAKDAIARSAVSFNGRSSRWDASPIGGEFNYGNSESMLVYEDEGSQNYYFFVDGRLWKWFKAINASAFGGGNFKKFAQSVSKKFGRGRDKSGEMTPGNDTKWIEYLDRNSRLRAADLARRGVYALIFEEMATVRQLASLRPAAAPKRSAMADDEEERPAPSAKSHSGREEVARAGGESRRSLFADENENKDESDSEYQARRDRLAKEERTKQARMHDRKQDAKKGEALRPLEGINDADPLSGL